MKRTKHKAGGRKQDIYDQYIKRAFMCVCVSAKQSVPRGGGITRHGLAQTVYRRHRVYRVERNLEVRQISSRVTRVAFELTT